MAWTDSYRFEEPIVDLRGCAEDSAGFQRELLREVGPGHSLHGRQVAVIARALPQDDVVVVLESEVAMVHLTWTQRTEPAPLPETTFLSSPEEFEAWVQERYDWA